MVYIYYDYDSSYFVVDDSRYFIVDDSACMYTPCCNTISECFEKGLTYDEPFEHADTDATGYTPDFVLPDSTYILLYQANLSFYELSQLPELHI